MLPRWSTHFGQFSYNHHLRSAWEETKCMLTDLNYQTRSVLWIEAKTQISMKVLTSSRAVRKIREALLLSGLSGKICHHHYKHKPPWMVVQTDDPTFKPIWVSKIPTLLRRTKKTTNCNVNWLLHECSDQIPSSEKPTRHEVMPFVSYSLRAKVMASWILASMNSSDAPCQKQRPRRESFRWMKLENSKRNCHLKRWCCHSLQQSSYLIHYYPSSMQELVPTFTGKTRTNWRSSTTKNKVYYY